MPAAMSVRKLAQKRMRWLRLGEAATAEGFSMGSLLHAGGRSGSDGMVSRGEQPGQEAAVVGSVWALGLEAEPPRQLAALGFAGGQLVERAVVDDAQASLHPAQEVIGGSEIPLLVRPQHAGFTQCVQDFPDVGL